MVMVSADKPYHSNDIDSQCLNPSFLDVKVVVGSGETDYVGDIEIYSQNNNSFQYGPALPYPLKGAATVQYGDSLIIVGGYNDNCYCDNSGRTVIRQQ